MAELLLAGAISLLGYEISKNGKKPRENPNSIKKNRMPNEYPIRSDDSLIGTNEMDTMNLTPYFTSAKSQNTNEDIKQRRVEMFTGNDNYSYSKKCEKEPLFKPMANREGPIEDNQRLQHYIVSGKMDGTRPFEQMHVGTGLNVGGEVVAKGGFHDTTRIMPDHLLSYTKTTYKGRVVAGKSLTTERPEQYNLDKNRPETTWQGRSTELQEGRSQVTGIKQRGRYQNEPTNRGQCETYIGIANGPDAHPSDVNTTRSRDSSLPNKLGIAGSDVPASYVNGAYVIPGTERGNCGYDPTNVSGYVNGPHSIYNDNARTTLRSMSQKNPYSGPAGLNTGGYTKDGRPLSTTLRNTTNRGYSGIAGTGEFTAPQGGVYKANMTTREQTGSNKGLSGGPAGPAVVNTTVSYDAAYNADNYVKAGQKAYVPGAGRSNDQQNPCEIMSNVLAKEDANCARDMGALKVRGQNNYTNINQYGTIQDAAHLPVRNNRNYFDVANTQLAKNPYAISINPSPEPKK